MEKTSKEEQRALNKAAIHAPDDIKDQKIKDCVIASLKRSQDFLMVLNLIKEKVTTEKVLTTEETTTVEMLEKMGLDLESFFGVPIEDIVKEQKAKNIDKIKGVEAKLEKKAETKVKGEKEPVKPESEHSSEFLADEAKKAAVIAAKKEAVEEPMTPAMKKALAEMAEANVSLPQLEDGASPQALSKLKEAGLSGDEVKKLEQQGVKLKEVEEALGGKESESTEAKMKSAGMPNLLENMAAEGVTPEAIAKMENEGMDMDKLQKLIEEPLSEGLVKSMADAEKKVDFVKEANAMIMDHKANAAEKKVKDAEGEEAKAAADVKVEEVKAKEAVDEKAKECEKGENKEKCMEELGKKNLSETAALTKKCMLDQAKCLMKCGHTDNLNDADTVCFNRALPFIKKMQSVAKQGCNDNATKETHKALNDPEESKKTCYVQMRFNPRPAHKLRGFHGRLW